MKERNARRPAGVEAFEVFCFVGRTSFRFHLDICCANLKELRVPSARRAGIVLPGCRAEAVSNIYPGR